MTKQVNIRLTDAAYAALVAKARVAMDTPTGFATRVLMLNLQRPLDVFPLCCTDPDHDCAAHA
jgi:hypothetical protein